MKIMNGVRSNSVEDVGGTGACVIACVVACGGLCLATGTVGAAFGVVSHIKGCFVIHIKGCYFITYNECHYEKV